MKSPFLTFGLALLGIDLTLGCLAWTFRGWQANDRYLIVSMVCALLIVLLASTL